MDSGLNEFLKQPIVLTLLVIIVGSLILWVITVGFLIFLAVRRRPKDKLYAPEGVKVKESDEEDEIYEPSVLQMGKCSAYPVCPNCIKEMNNLLVLSNGDSDIYGEGCINILICPHCHVFLGTMEP
jgi:hypothetical protein